MYYFDIKVNISITKDVLIKNGWVCIIVFLKYNSNLVNIDLHVLTIYHISINILCAIFSNGNQLIGLTEFDSGFVSLLLVIQQFRNQSSRI